MTIDETEEYNFREHLWFAMRYHTERLSVAKMSQFEKAEKGCDSVDKGRKNVLVSSLCH